MRSVVMIAKSSAGAFLLTLAAVLLAQAPRVAEAPTPAAATSAAETQLHRAANTGNLALLRARLRQGVNPNVLDGRGQTALMVAARTGHVTAAKLLLDAGADVNAHSRSGRTALIEAAETGHLNTARLLIKRGADVNAAARTGTALETAERTGHTKIAALLRQAGAHSSGHSLGDTVCVRPWGGDGYCGVVESIDKNDYRLRVTTIVGCTAGCPARGECSADLPVGGASGIRVGDYVDTRSWCLTHTGVKP